MNDKFSECNMPFTKCWCEAVPGRQNNPHCKSLIPSVPIENNFLAVTIFIGIIIFIYLGRPKKNRAIVLSVKDNFTPKLRMTSQEMKKLNYLFEESKIEKKDNFFLKFIYVFAFLGLCAWVALIIYLIKQAL